MLYAIDYMQQMTPEICAEVPTPTSNTGTTTRYDEQLYDNAVSQGGGKSTLVPEKYLIDKRDGKSYVVRKLADGNCWMMQNLALNSGITITSADSNIQSSYTLPTAMGFNDNYAGFVANDNHADNTLSSNGNYYSWCAATAGTCNNYKNMGENAIDDICPKGWRLPTNDGTDSSELFHLSRMSGFDAVFLTVMTGSYSGGKKQNSGTNVAWWSSTSSNATQSYTYSKWSNNTRHNEPSDRSMGNPLRCIAKTNIR